MQIRTINSQPNTPNFRALTRKVAYSRRFSCLNKIEKRAFKRANKYEKKLHKYLNKAGELSRSDNFIDILKKGLFLCKARFWKWRLYKCADWVYDWCETNYQVGLGQRYREQIKMRVPEYRAKVEQDKAKHRARLKNMPKSYIQGPYFWHYD